MSRKSTLIRIVQLCAFLALVIPAYPEVMLQWFETDWEEMYRKMPLAAEIGYDYLWVPPPTKAPTGLGTKWGNVGYSLYDRFDIGDIPQRGSWATRYGTRGDLRRMVDAAHRMDVKIIPDIVMNHAGNGPDIRTYPGMVPTDFHVQYSANYLNDLNYKRAPTMTQWSPNNGYGGTMWQDLANLIDIRTEDHPLNGDPKRFTGPKTIEGVYFDFVDGTKEWRQIGRYETYPYAYTNDNSAEMLYRWIVWLGNAMDYDGLRIDAGKHTPYEFFGWKHAGFLHEAQYNFSQRRGFSDPCTSWPDDTFNNYLLRTNALLFAEILSPWSEIDYWFKSGTANPMRFLDYQIKKTADGALNGNIGNFYGYGTDFGPNNGIMYIWGHDEGPGSKATLGYAYTLTHIGMPMVYYTGNNITWDDYGRSPDKKTWMIPGYDSQALGEVYDDVANLVWINQQFARGSEQNLWHDGDFLAYERYDTSASSAEGLLVVALNDSGGDIGHTLSGLHFPDGTVLHDYTGNNASDVTVNGGSAYFTVPGNGGQGWVCYAPRIPESLNVRILQSGVDAPTMPWVIPGGTHQAPQTQQVTRITSTNFTVDFTFAPPSGGSVDSAMLKWGSGKQLTTNFFDGGRGIVSGQHEQMIAVNSTNWQLAVSGAALSEGLNLIKCRAFVSRTAGYPALFNTQTKVVYVDQTGPGLTIWPTNNANVVGDCVMVISNADFTAYGITVGVGGVTNTAHEITKGTWKYNLSGLGAGSHTLTIRATEADWADARSVVNSSVYTQTLVVAANPNTITFNATAEGGTNMLPFFTTGVNAPGSPDSVKLYWHGYELPFNAGTYSNAFNGEIILRDYLGHVVTDRLWGAFVNGAQFFEAVRVDAGATSRASRRIVFNLYGINAIDSDGDALPDNVEMPFIDSNGAPGADQPWPGDNNKNFIPESWETWTRLNPYNHSTYYSGQWDDRNDFDGDGYDNGTEVLAGFYSNNIYLYNIYDGSSHPSGSIFTQTTASAASWSPSNAVHGSNITVTYNVNDGALKESAQVVMHIGHSARTLGYWTNAIDTNMTSLGGGAWQASYLVPTNATSVDFTFFDGASTWDGKDWQANIAGGTAASGFTMDGYLDNSNYVVFADAMRIAAAVKGSDLYVATWSAEGSDHFLYVTDEPGDAKATPWAKAGYVFFDTSTKPFLTAESYGAYVAWNNSGSTNAFNGDRTPTNRDALEGVINLVDAFGAVPDAVYICAVAYGNNDGDGILSQGPFAWDSGDNIDSVEFLRVPIASVRDNDGDGTFDAGKPEMWTVVNGNTNDANYGLRRTFLNELAGDSMEITVILKPLSQPNDSTNVVSDVELFSNINRRDFAALPGDEDWSLITPETNDKYYRAYPMTSIGGGRYAVTIRVDKCGAYRINARFRINGGSYVYYTDNGLRRDCAVVVSPKKSLDLTMYELNPLVAEATSDDFYGRSTFEDMVKVNVDRPDTISTSYFSRMGMNMIWLQPIHPIGNDNKQTDPSTGSPYDPGSPYAVRNYWKVSSVLGDPASSDQAMTEFTKFVEGMDSVRVGVMLDGTFNHSAWDCEVGEVGVDLFAWATNETDLIREVRPEWYSKRGSYGDHATHYFSAADNDIAPAPDRMDFGKWNDAADFFFGTYDALVQGAPADTNWAWASQWYSRYLFEDDQFAGFATSHTRDLWLYFAQYPIYWLEKTGHPQGTPKGESYKGIDGLRCDFAQGLPSAFWEYTINKTRSVKWDFLFMAESLDGYRTVNGSTRHGVGYRSSRHFDILNENMVFYWRDSFFDYFGYSGGAEPYTYETWKAFDDRRNAFDVSPILLNLTSHDEIYPSDAQWRLIYAYAIQSAMDGVPMLIYGQEGGAQNDNANYGGGTDKANNFARYETNFSKSIPNFKRYNHMTNIWNGLTNSWKTPLNETYQRINWARLHSPALRSQNNYMLAGTNSGWNPKIFSVAKFEQAGVSAASQDVVFVAVNNDYVEDANRWDRYNLNVDVTAGVNWFGIQDSHTYNVINLSATNPTTYLWSPGKPGTEVKTNFWVLLNGDTFKGEQVQYLKLIDTAVGIAGYPYLTNAEYRAWDWDNDGLPNDWETANGLNPHDATGINGGGGDRDGDGVSNNDEFFANTVASNANDFLELFIDMDESGAALTWPSKTNINYLIEKTDALVGPGLGWQSFHFGTALSNEQAVTETVPPQITNRFYRVRVLP